MSQTKEVYVQMDVNSVSSVAATYASYESTAVRKSAQTEAAKDSAPVEEEAAAVYEKSEEAKAYKPDTKTVQQMLADTEERVQQFRDMIQKMFSQQAKTSSIADDIWQKLAKGDFAVDAATKAKAQEDISENGYWGVKQTSERILDFAKALTGGDPDKMEKMRTAFEKGYKQAEKTWGGQLPDISKQTYDAVMKGFDDMKNQVEA